MTHTSQGAAVGTDWRRRFFTLWTAQALSLFGSSLVQFALIWWLTTTTGSATVLATATLVALLPHVLLGPLAGAIVDRANRRAIMIVADGAIALCTLLLGWLFWQGAVQTWHIYGLMLARSLGGAFHFPAMQASTSLMVPDDQLSRVAGMNQTLNGAMGIVAPATGALLISVMPVSVVMLIDVSTALLAIVTLLVIGVPQPARRRDAPAQRQSLLADMRDGVRFVWGWRGMVFIIAMAVVINFLVTPAMSLLPLLITRHFGGAAPHLALFDAAWGGGMIIGGLLLSRWGGFKNRIHTSMLGLSGLGLGLTLLGIAPGWAMAMGVAGLALGGISNPITNGPIFALMQSAVPADMQGRIFSLIGSLTAAVSPLGLLIAGPVSDAIGVRVWIVFGGIVCIAMAGVGMMMTPVRNLESEARTRAATLAVGA